MVFFADDLELLGQDGRADAQVFGDAVHRRVQRQAGLAGEHEVAALHERAEPRRDGIPGLAAHDDGAAPGQFLEMRHVFGQMPGHGVVDADAAIVGAGGNQGDFLHNKLSLGFQTASYTKYNGKPTSPCPAIVKSSIGKGWVMAIQPWRLNPSCLP